MNGGDADGDRRRALLVFRSACEWIGHRNEKIAVVAITGSDSGRMIFQ